VYPWPAPPCAHRPAHFPFSQAPPLLAFDSTAAAAAAAGRRRGPPLRRGPREVAVAGPGAARPGSALARPILAPARSSSARPGLVPARPAETVYLRGHNERAGPLAAAAAECMDAGPLRSESAGPRAGPRDASTFQWAQGPYRQATCTGRARPSIRVAMDMGCAVHPACSTSRPGSGSEPSGAPVLPCAAAPTDPSRPRPHPALASTALSMGAQ
jgi:hypothetical protein